MKIMQIAALAAFGLCFGAQAQDKTTDVAAALKGKVVEITEKGAADGVVNEGLEYYVFYHSASW